MTGKRALTVLFTAFLCVAGFLYQRAYHAERRMTTETVAGFYRKYFDREPDVEGLNHWVMWSMHRWGLERVEREGFVEAKAKGAK